MNFGDYITCILLFIPIFIWNVLLYKKLPEPYQNTIWDKIPKELDVSENVLRFVSFILPIFLKLEIKSTIQIVGLFLYIFGVFIYFASWIMQIKYPTSKWSKSIVGSMAPAYTTIIWFVGIAFIGQRLIFNVSYNFAIYIVIAVVFVLIHTYHSYYVYVNNKKEDA